jgi:SAM-dependent methyltransferase
MGGGLGWLVRDPRGRLKRLRLRLTVVPPRTAAQKRSALARPELSTADRELLRRTDSRVHPYDDMYAGDGFMYFWAGIAAVRAIDAALDAACADPPGAILDMPCGFGRVMRALAARFPAASITGCDIHPISVRFCSRRFRSQPAISSPAFEQLAFPDSFDLVWCGSLVTHLSPSRTLALVDLFARSCRRGGLVVFTTHGEYIAEMVRAGDGYRLDPGDVPVVLDDYERTGYGYANYPWEQEYGVSLISPQWIRTHVDGRSRLEQVWHAERGWGGGHDVFAFRKA